MFSISGGALFNLCRSVLRLSQAKRFYSLFDENKLCLVKRVESSVSPDAKIYLETPMHVKILPLIDLEGTSKSEKLILSVYGKKAEDRSQEFSIKRTQKRLDVIGKTKEANAEDLCVIEAPVQSSFDIKALADASIHIQRMLTPICHIKTEHGYTELQNIKGGEIQVLSDEGNVKCEGALHAQTVDFKTGLTGSVHINHIVAKDLRIGTHAGNIETKSCYSEKSHLITAIGNLRLASLHSDCTIEVLQVGDVTISGFEGSIRAILKRGNMFLQSSKFTGKTSVFIHEKGKVDLLIDSLDEISTIELIAAQLQVEEALKSSGTLSEEAHLHRYKYSKTGEDGEPDVRLECRNGSIDIKQSSWIESITNGSIKRE